MECLCAPRRSGRGLVATRDKGEGRHVLSRTRTRGNGTAVPFVDDGTVLWLSLWVFQNALARFGLPLDW